MVATGNRTQDWLYSTQALCHWATAMLQSHSQQTNKKFHFSKILIIQWIFSSNNFFFILYCLKRERIHLMSKRRLRKKLWRAKYMKHSENIWELLSRVLACRVWGLQWNGKEIVVYCGNMAAEGVVNSGYSQVEAVMHLLQSLFLFGPTSNWQCGQSTHEYNCKCHQSGTRQYTEFVLRSHCYPFPVTESNLMYFVLWMHRK